MRFVASLGLCMALTGSLMFARQAPNVSSLTLEAHKLLSVLYPECQNPLLMVDVTRTGRSVQLRVIQPDPNQQLRARDANEDVMLSARLEFDSGSALTSLRVTGPLLRDADNVNLRTRLRASSQPADLLSSELPAFRLTTSAAAQSAAPLASLARVVGSLSVATVRLKLVATDPSSSYGAVWELTATGQKPGQARRDYAVQLEPYGGRLIGLKLLQ